MTYEELLHAVRAAAEVAHVDELLVFGSQAILLEHPDAVAELRQSVELDAVARKHPERWELIDGALGEDSPFHRTHGFYVHGVGLETATFPEGWEARAVTHTLGSPPVRVITPEVHDLAASKLAAGRDKDFDYVTVLIKHDYVDTRKLLRRVAKLPGEAATRERLRQWIGAVAVTLSGQPSSRDERNLPEM
jgi:hypothetical protein